MGPGIGGLKTACVIHTKSEASIVSWIAKNEDPYPSGSFTAGQPITNKETADTSPLARRQHCDRPKRQCRKWRFHLRQHGMADDLLILNGHQREDDIARLTKVINQLCFGRSGEGGRLDRSGGNEVGRSLKSNNHKMSHNP